jgi:hypothetical protein
LASANIQRESKHPFKKLGRDIFHSANSEEIANEEQQTILNQDRQFPSNGCPPSSSSFSYAGGR